MRSTIRPESVLEGVALAFNLAPTPLVDTQIACNGARAIMAGAALGVYEALDSEAHTAEEIAAECHTHLSATRKLLDCLTGIGYLTFRSGRYRLPVRLRKWLLKKSPTSVVDKLIFQLTEWSWMENLEEYVRTGEPLDFHARMTEEQWAQYQSGMRDLSATLSAEVARRLTLPAGATRMLDVGGSHGLYSAALCRRYPKLASTVIDLPGAIERARELVARHGLGERLVIRAGDALTDDFGTAEWDVVFISNVVHHFTAEQNVALAKKVHRALRPRGIFVVGEFLRGSVPGEGGAIGATSDLYFALTSASGTWSLEEIQGWMREAGFGLEKPIRYVGPAYVSVVGKK